MPSSEPLIELRDVDFSHPGGRRVLKGFNFVLPAGRKIGLAGANGCGKTTALSVIMGLLFPERGEVRIFGRPRRTDKDFRDIRPQMGFVFQDSDDQLFCPTVADDLAFGPLNLGFSRKEAGRIAAETLDLLGLSGFGPRLTGELSGGEKRLAAIGAALALKPRLLILDEPTNSLDEAGTARLERILDGLGLPCLMVSHDRGFLRRTVQEIWIMAEGRLVKE